MVNYKENVYGRRGLGGRNHIPELPYWVALIRIAQFILTLIVLILVAYASSVFGAAFIPGYGHAFFTFSWTVLFLIYIFVTPLYYPDFYNYLIHLAWEITLAIFWLSTWALLAQEASAFDTTIGDANALLSAAGDIGDNINNYLPSSYNNAIGATKAAAGLGALTWALFVATLVLFSLAVRQHRIANGESGFRFGHSTARPVDVESSPTGQEKYTTQAHTHPYQPPMEMNDVRQEEHQVSLPAAA